MAIKEFTSQMWSNLTGASKAPTVTDKAIVEVLDMVLMSATSAAAFDTLMLVNNSLTVSRNNHGVISGKNNGNINVQALYNIISSANNAVSSKTGISTVPGAHAIQDWEKVLAEPNIAGVPISASRMETSREVEVSESMVIVQDSAQKKYWTDNAVPRLKEWSIEGYITSASALDVGCVIKPSLTWQAYYLDVCAKSRRPVMFKTNRGEFVKVQITSLKTDEDASYNNAIKVYISLKEYNPYTVTSDIRDISIAVQVGGN